MADPARYHIDAEMHCDGDFSDAVIKTHRSASGKWIKWHDFLDYKAAQRRNASAATNESLGLEVVALRNEVEHLKTCIKTLQDAALLFISERKKEKSQSTPASDCSSKP